MKLINSQGPDQRAAAEAVLSKSALFAWPFVCYFSHGAILPQNALRHDCNEKCIE